VIATVTAQGYEEVTEDTLRPIVADVIQRIAQTGEEAPI
jgi:hypothetical protein